MKSSVIFLWAYSMCFQAIREYQNYDWILIDSKGHKTIGQIPSDCFSEIYFENLDDWDRIDELVQSIRQRKNIFRIITSYEACVELAGHLRSKYNIRGPSEAQSLLFRDKFLMKQELLKKNIPMAKFVLVSSESYWEDHENELQFPIIIKPPNGFGTAFTYFVKNYQDLKLLFGMLSYPVQVENFIPGTEYHCDSFTINGKVVFSSVGKYLFPMLRTIDGKEPVGSVIYPNTKKNRIVDRIRQLNNKVISIMNLDFGMCHAEFFYSYGKIYFSEIALRLGGGPVICPCIQNSQGIDMFKTFLEVNLGIWHWVPAPKDVYTGFVCFPSKKGKIVFISGIHDFDNFPGVIKITILNKVGDKITDERDTTVRTGSIIVENKKYTPLVSELKDIYNTFHLEVD